MIFLVNNGKRIITRGFLQHMIGQRLTPAKADGLIRVFEEKVVRQSFANAFKKEKRKTMGRAKNFQRVPGIH